MYSQITRPTIYRVTLHITRYSIIKLCLPHWTLGFLLDCIWINPNIWTRLGPILNSSIYYISSYTTHNSIILKSSYVDSPYLDWSMFFFLLDYYTRLPTKAAVRLLSIPQAWKRLPRIQTSILNCNKTLLPLLPIQINWKSCINLPLKTEISNYASVGIFMILGVVVWNGSWLFTYACCSYDLYPLIT